MMILIGAAVVIFLILMIAIWLMMSEPAPVPDVLPPAEDPLPDTQVVETPAAQPPVPTPQVVQPPAPTPAPSVAIQTPSGTTYTFFQGMDSGGNDIGNSGLANNIPALKAWCTEREACKGFNTNGWMKHTIRPQASWYRWIANTPGNENKGMFVKSEHFRNPMTLFTPNATEHFRRWRWRNPLVLFRR